MPETEENKGIVAWLARIGVGPGKNFEFKDLLSDVHKTYVLLLLGMKEGDDKVSA